MIQVRTILAAAAIALSMPMAAPAAAQDFPLVAGDYAEFSGIYVEDGAAFKYARHLADQWVKSQEFAKKQGWISDYKIYMNVNPREGEPNIYLMTSFASMPDAAEQDRRAKAYDKWAQKTAQQMIAESGNRAEYRKLLSSILVQEYTPR